MLLWVYISTPGELEKYARRLVVGSIPTVAGHIFQARPMWIYTQSNITKHHIHLSTQHQHREEKNH
jgi:hypothetical protein